MRRSDVEPFFKKNYDLSCEHVRTKFPSHVLAGNSSINYVCKNCHMNISNGGKGELKGKPSSEKAKYEVFVCTCCHKDFNLRKKVVSFKESSYDYSNSCVSFALDSTVRRKHGIFEFICNSCHYSLRKTKYSFPTIPVSAAARKLKNKSIVGDTNWEKMLFTMGNCKTFRQLQCYVSTLGTLPALPQTFIGTKQLKYYRRDVLAYALVPEDFPFDKSNFLTVYTSGDGNCFMHCLSRIVYGNECHTTEMRVRIAVEAVKNIQKYTSHDYLCRGYNFPHAEGVHLGSVYSTYTSFYQDGMDVSESKIDSIYKREVMTICRDGTECGLWQFHQAANALGRKIISLHKKLDHSDFFQKMRKDLNREILPACELCPDDQRRLIMILWSKGASDANRFNHFVPVVERDRNIPTIDMNTDQLVLDLYRGNGENANMVSCEIDIGNEQVISDGELNVPATGAASVVVDVADGSVAVDVEGGNHGLGSNSGDNIDDSTRCGDKRRTDDNIDEYFERYKCTCCHKERPMRSLKKFEECAYNMENEDVREALKMKFRMFEEATCEFICNMCHHYLAMGKMPRNSAANSEQCTYCYMVVPRSRVKVYDSTIYEHSDFDLSCMLSFHKIANENGQIMICNGCSTHIGSMCKIVINGRCSMMKVRNKFEENEEKIKARGRPDKTERFNRRKVKFEQELGAVRDKFLQKLRKEKAKVNKMIAEETRKEIEKEKSRAGSLSQEREDAINAFKKSKKEFPEFVCTCCHRMMFKKSVTTFNINKYKMDAQWVSRSLRWEFRCKKNEQEEYICITCHRTLVRQKMPCQAVANGLLLPPIPDELQHLSRLEVRCISLRIPFMRIHAMKKGGVGRITGPCINVPSTLEPITHILPRVPEDTHLILIKLKRMLVYRSSYLEDYIRPNVVMEALKWLIKHNPHYKDVVVDDNWLEHLRNDPAFRNVCEGSLGLEQDEVEDEVEDDGMEEVQAEQSCSDSDSGNIECEMEAENVEIENLAADQDEVNRKAAVTVEPSSTCVQFDDVEQVAFSIAPGEDGIPKFILLDDDFEVLAFPNLFPGGFGGYDTTEPRPSNLTLRSYIHQRLRNKDTRFQDTEYIFSHQYAVELKQLRSEIRINLKKSKAGGDHGRVNAGRLRNFETIGRLIIDDLALRFMANVRGTPAYWQKQLFDILAYLRTFGTPTWFLTLSPAEFLWPEILQAIGRRYGLNFSEKDVEVMDWETKATYLRNNPVIVVQMFQHRLDAFFHDYILSEYNPLGRIAEYCIKIEFQARGSPHAHCLLWVKDAPNISSTDTTGDEDVAAFVDRYVSGTVPEETEGNEELRSLVLKLQTHSHSSYCRRHIHAKCRFNFPKAPTPKTVVARRRPGEEPLEDKSEEREIMRLVHENIEKKPLFEYRGDTFQRKYHRGEIFELLASIITQWRKYHSEEGPDRCQHKQLQCRNLDSLASQYGSTDAR